MNNCILMATVIRNPELRFTQDNQTPIAQMLVEFPGTRPEDPPQTLKVIGWGNLGTEIQETYSEGDRLIIEGRLSMQMVDRPEGFKEKRAELVASRIHPLDGSSTKSDRPAAAYRPPQETSENKNVIDLDQYKTAAAKTTSAPQPTPTPTATTPVLSDADLDEIPF